ncbi:NAD-dependent succinate-semialdehyde dehydrogenase [Agrobacterium sp. DE0009]|uniref:NAD-dependent succinate-semialdehyde dehydrogenase n=1 Tax=Agrobacterium sp. DE0009 TaxID=2587505 RepID=UPI00119EE975|nr:NAD-dependent succinate-semialdehyde dehydrogenase [Agrobacterium sp. DE0009]
MNRHGLKDPSLFVEKAYIGGEWRDAVSSKTLDVDNPSTGKTIGTIPACGAVETNAAIEAADAAFKSYRKTTAEQRAALLERWFELVIENVEDLARIMTLEQGKPLAEAAGEVRYGASFIKWFAEEARRVNGYTIPSPSQDRRIVILKDPVGVSAAITPWNFPIAMITRKCAPALAAGCPIIVKPSELTPYSALALALLAERAGFPHGTLSVITGLPQEIGAALTASETVRKLSFTGSTRVGALLMEQCASTIKRLSLELGGNAPFIVFDDADLDLAVAGVMASKFRNAGQTCVCANRVLVQNGIYDRFAARLLEEVAKLSVGDGLASGSNLGPLINDAAVEKVRAHVADALAKGASLLTQKAEHDAGRFVTPIVIGNARVDMRVANEETFGPLVPLFRFGTDEEAIEIANGTPFGLASYFYTQDLKRSWRVGEALEFGMVGLNTGSVSMEVAPFGGVKQSGLGREGAQAGIDEYLETKSFHISGL